MGHEPRFGDSDNALLFKIAQNAAGGSSITAAQVISALGYTPAVAGAGVTSFNARTGAVTLNDTDVVNALGFVPADESSVVASFNLRQGVVTLLSSDVTSALGYTPAGANVSQVITYAATSNIDMVNAVAVPYREITLGGNVTFTTSNVSNLLELTIRIIGDGSTRNLTFPAGWKFVGGAAPTQLAANKEAILTIVAFGNNDASIRAAYAAEP